MTLHKHMLKLFMVIDHAIKTRLDLYAGVMTPEQRSNPHYKVSGISAWREMERTAMKVMADEWMWMPDVTHDHVKNTLIWIYNHDSVTQYETDLDRQIRQEVIQYVNDLFDTDVEIVSVK